MAYDYNVPGGTVAAPDTLFGHDPRDPNAKDWTWDTVGTVANYLLNGVPASKIVVGVPFYGNQYLNTGAERTTVSTRRSTTPGSTRTASPRIRHRSRPTTSWWTAPGDVSADGKTGANGYTVYWDFARRRAVPGQPGGVAPDAGDRPGDRPDGDHVHQPGLDRRAHRADQGAEPAWRDGVGDQPGLRLGRADQRTLADPALVTRR